MVCGFEPLFHRLVYIRHLSLVRPAVSEPINPMHCLLSFYYTDFAGRVVFSTDKKPSYNPTLNGKITYFLLTDFILGTSSCDRVDHTLWATSADSTGVSCID